MSKSLQNSSEEQGNLHIVENLDKQSLPKPIQDMLSLASTPDEEDILLLSMLTGVSACIPYVYFRYGPTGKKYYANLQFFIIAGPASGKGIAGQSQRMVNVVYAQHPLSIPGGSTYPAWFQSFYQQNGCGFMYESEGSVITDTWKASVSDYNTALRKAAEHEPISKNRVRAGKMVIDTPKLSMLLTGTHKQYKKLVPDVENGYFSRLITLFVQGSNPFNKHYVTDISAQSAIPEKVGNYLLNMYDSMANNGEIEWTLNQGQKDFLGNHFEAQYKTLIKMLGQNFHSTVIRMPIHIERIAMILSALRRNFGVCIDVDFQTALTIGNILLQHMATSFRYINGDAQDVVPNIKPVNRCKLLFDQLPQEYNRGTLIAEANALGISERSAERYNNSCMDEGLVVRVNHGIYRKVA